MNILITGAFALTQEEKSELESSGHNVTFHKDERCEVEHPELFEAVVCNSLFLYNPIERFPNLHIIQLTSAGLDRVPLEYINEHGIELHNASGVYSIPMAEFAICGILDVYKQSRYFTDNQRAGIWEKNRGLLELFGKKVCILGCGEVGREIAKRLKAFGCKIIGVNRTVRDFPEFDKILPIGKLVDAVSESDIFICAVALTPETRGIVSKKVFECLKRGAVFVNVARGYLVDEEAMIVWLQKGGHAVLDVFGEEPLPKNSPLWEMENVTISPHNCFVGDGVRARMWGLIRKNIQLAEEKQCSSL